MLVNLLTKRWFQIFLLLSLLSGLVWLSFTRSPLIYNLRQLTFDSYNRYQPRKPGDETVIVDIDEASLQHYGQWPWQRTLVADLTKKIRLLGAKAVVFDMVFSESDRTSPSAVVDSLPQTPEMLPVAEALRTLPDNDQVFAQKISEAGRVVMGFVLSSAATGRDPPANPHLCLAHRPYDDPENPRHYVIKTGNFTTALPVLSSAAAGNAIFSILPEKDGVIRSVPLLVGQQDASGKVIDLHPTLALEALRVSMGDQELCYNMTVDPAASADNSGITEVLVSKIKRISKDNGGEIVSTRPYIRIPVSRDGRIQVYYTGHRTKIYVPAWEVIEGKAKPELLKDKIVFVGTSAIGLLDVRASPIDGFLPGVEVHAEITEQILHGQYLNRPQSIEVKELLAAVVISLAIIVLTYFISAGVLALIVSLLVAGGVFGSLLFYKQGLLIDPVYPSIIVVIIFIASSILANLRSEMEKRMIRQAFDRYLSPDLIEELVKHPEKLKLGGEVRELTVMFTDIRNFTTISESMDPAELIRMMNDFLTPMTSAVLDNNGFVDKYMGDAMMTFWNAPVDMPEHAKSACRAALEMVAALKPVNTVLKTRAEEAGKPFHELRAGIGINSGKASVGNMGSKQRFAYSALGDTVNLASRLEGQTKGYGISTMISSSTREQAPEFAAIELDLLIVKGRTEPERIYGLLGGPEEAQSSEFKDFSAKHEQLLDAYRGMRWGEALTLAGECTEARHDLEQLYKLYRDRIIVYKQNPPPAGWAGVWVAKDK